MPLKVLIVEDEIIIALELEAIVADVAEASCIMSFSVAQAKSVLRNEHVDLALLDIDMRNDRTFDVARILLREHVPYAFVSSMPRDEVPEELRDVPFVRKPFHPAEIERAVEALLH
jgi:two-component SAPR family response regulator